MKIYEARGLEENSPRRFLINRSIQRKQSDPLKCISVISVPSCSIVASLTLLDLAEFQMATIPCLIAKWVSSALLWIWRDSII